MTTIPGSCRRPACPPFYVAQATYNYQCHDGRNICITREGRSPLSVQHAHQLAMQFAMCEAQRQAACVCYDPARAQPYPFVTCPPPGGPNFRFDPATKKFQLHNSTTGSYHTLTIEGEAGFEVLVIGDPE